MRFTILLLLYNYSNAKGFSHCFHFGKDEESSQTHYTGDDNNLNTDWEKGSLREKWKTFGNVVFMNGCVTVEFANQDNVSLNEQKMNRECNLLNPTVFFSQGNLSVLTNIIRQ